MPVFTASPTFADSLYLDALYESIKEAHSALRPAVCITPLTYSARLSALSGCEVLLKCEHLQHTGSFKFRGASNKIRLLPTEARKRGVIAASSGNHGQALALAGKPAGVPVTVYTATSASPYKLEAMRALGAEVLCLPTDPLSAELEAGRQAKAQGVPFVSPYNDLQVIAGQGTIGMELFEQAHPTWTRGCRRRRWRDDCRHRCRLARARPGTEIYSAAGRRMTLHWSNPSRPERLSRWTPAKRRRTAQLAASSPAPSPLPLCQALLTDDTVLVSEDEIRAAMRDIASNERWIIEGAAAVAVAGMKSSPKSAPCRAKRVR